jgi:hypothetical protein
VSTPDDDLTIALAEYAHLNELRHQLEQKSSNRFNFFLALSTTSAAVTAALLSQFKGSQVNIAAGALLGMVLVVGFATYLRQLRFARQNARLDAAQIALRTYLARRAPTVRAYMFLPVEDDRGVLLRGKTNWINQSLGLPGNTAIINSALLALALAFAIGPDPLTAIVFILALGSQIGYIGRARARWAREIRLLNEARGIHPSGDA